MADVAQSSAKPVSPDPPETCADPQLITDDEPLELPVDDDLSLAELIESELAARSSKVHEMPQPDEILSPDEPMFDDGHELDPAEIFDPGSPESDSQPETPETESSSQGGIFKPTISKVSTMFTTSKDSPDGAAATAAFLLAERDNLVLPSFDPFSTIEADDDCFSPDRPIQGAIGQQIPEIGIISPDDDSGSYGHLDSFVDPPEIIEDFIEAERKHTDITSDLTMNEPTNEIADEVTDLTDKVQDITDKAEEIIDSTDKCEEVTFITDENVELIDLVDKDEEMTDLVVKGKEEINLSDKGEEVIDLTDNGEKVIDFTDNSEEVIDLTDNSDKVIDLTDNGEKVIYLTDNGEEVIDLTDKGEQVTDLDSLGLQETLSPTESEPLCLADNAGIDFVTYESVIEGVVSSPCDVNNLVEELTCEKPQTCADIIQENIPKNEAKSQPEKYMNGPIEMNGSLDLNGPVDLDGPIDMNGPADINGPTDMNGPDDINGPIDINGPTDMNGPIDPDEVEHETVTKAVSEGHDDDPSVNVNMDQIIEELTNEPEDILVKESDYCPEDGLRHEPNLEENQSVSDDQVNNSSSGDGLVHHPDREPAQQPDDSDDGLREDVLNNDEAPNPDIALPTNQHDQVETSSCSSDECSVADDLDNVAVNGVQQQPKKKKKTEGGEKKKSKKKRGECEKENISVQVSNGHPATPESVSTAALTDADELINVNVKALKTCYSDVAFRPSRERVRREIDQDILHCGPIQSLRQTYCSQVARNRASSNDRNENRTPIATGVDIKHLRRSFGDLSSCCDAEGSVPADNGDDDPRSSFSKFDQLTKKTVLHVRSVDASKVQKQFNQSAGGGTGEPAACRSCGKQVFQMEQVKAERAVWHKNCFRCAQCNKQLTVDIYQSHEGTLYCKPHFRELFKPKAVVDNPEDTPVRLRRPEMIIRENQPLELPPDVVRASDKPDLGLEELASLNVKSRFQVFEQTSGEKSELDRSPSAVSVKRSPSILSKLARFQARGMDVGVTDDSLNGVPVEGSSSSSESESEFDEEDVDGVVKSARRGVRRERPARLANMDDVKSRWEKREEAREERKQEIQQIRSRLFHGHQGKMKELYEQAVQESERPARAKDLEDCPAPTVAAKSLKERFERGEVTTSGSTEETEDMNKEEERAVIEAGLTKKSRSLFLELDASAAKTAQSKPISPSPPIAKTKDASPEREIYRDPDIVRGDDPQEDDEVTVRRSQTASKMLSLFREMENNAGRETPQEGPKPLKRFTPPPEDYRPQESSSEPESDDEEDDEEDEDEDDGVVRSSDRPEDAELQQARDAAKAKSLRAKFERWEAQENEANQTNQSGRAELVDTENASLESAKSLRARFESLQQDTQQPKEAKTPRPKVNRFVELQSSYMELCSACDLKVYPLERAEIGGKIFHKKCFRCLQCNCILRMETYTLNSGKLYCIPHFKQLFISKGNYDEGFGLDQHKRKWNNRTTQQLILDNLSPNENSP